MALAHEAVGPVSPGRRAAGLVRAVLDGVHDRLAGAFSVYPAGTVMARLRRSTPYFEAANLEVTDVA